MREPRRPVGPALIDRWGSPDVASLLRRRLDAGEDGHVVGFWSRSERRLQTLSQHAFLRQGLDVASRLRELGVGPAQAVVVDCSTPRATLLAYLGAVSCAAVPVITPVHLGSRRPAGAGVGDLRRRLAAVAVLTDREAASASGPPDLGDALVVLVDPDATPAADSVNGDLLATRPPEAPLHLQLTSGSTGEARAAVVSHANVLANCRALSDIVAMDEGESIASWLPLYHDMGLVGMVLLSLLQGTDLHLLSPFDFLADPLDWLRVIAERQGAVTASPNFGYQLVATRAARGAGEGIDLGSLRVAGCGGEPIRPGTLGAFIERLAPWGLRPDVLRPCYGLAEGTLAVTFVQHRDGPTVLRVALGADGTTVAVRSARRATDHADPLQPGELELVSCGRPVSDTTLSIVDPSSGQPVAEEDAAGAVMVEGPGVVRGVWTAEGIAERPALLDTGDIGFLHGGELYILERASNLVIRHGQNVPASALESALAEGCGISADRVMVVEADIHDPAAPLVGVLEPPRHRDATALAGTAAVAGRSLDLPLDRVVVVRRGSLPRTTSGKKQHAALRRALQHDTLPVLAEAGKGVAVDADDSVVDLAAEDGVADITADEGAVRAAAGERGAVGAAAEGEPGGGAGPVGAAGPVGVAGADLVIDLRHGDDPRISRQTPLDAGGPAGHRAPGRAAPPHRLGESRALIEQTVLEELRRVCAPRGTAGAVRLAASLRQDLDLDSLALLDAVTAIEERTRCGIGDAVLADLRTVEDLVLAALAHPEEIDVSGLHALQRRYLEDIPQVALVVGAQDGRTLDVAGRRIVDFASCNYLGLDLHPDVMAAIGPMVRQWGVHPSWTRAVASPSPYAELERRLAGLVGASDVVVFPTVSLLHLGVLPVLTGGRGALLVDQAAHHSVHEAAELCRARGAEVVVYRHGDHDDLARRLEAAAHLQRRVIAVDGVYSMSGEVAAVAELVALAEAHDALVYIDDAHGFGVIGERPDAAAPFGRRGNGVVRHLGVASDRLVYVAGLSKAYSSMGAFVTCSGPEVRARLVGASTLVFGGPVPTASLASALAGLDVNDREGDAIRRRLHELTTALVDGVSSLGMPVSNANGFPIVTVELGHLDRVIAGCQVLWEHGILVTPAVFPAVPLDAGGVRFSVTAANTFDQVGQAVEAVGAASRLGAPHHARSQ